MSDRRKRKPPDDRPRSEYYRLRESCDPAVSMMYDMGVFDDDPNPKRCIITGTTGRVTRVEVRGIPIYAVPMTTAKGRVRLVHLAAPERAAIAFLTPGLWVSVPVMRTQGVWVTEFDRGVGLLIGRRRVRARPAAPPTGLGPGLWG